MELFFLITDTTGISFLVSKLSRLIVLFSSTNNFRENHGMDNANVAYLKSVSVVPQSDMSHIIESIVISCADPEGGTGGPDPPWNLKILPKKR